MALTAKDFRRMALAMTGPSEGALQNLAGAKPAAAKRVRRSAARAITLAAAMKLGAALPGVERTTTWGAPTLKLRGKMLACQAINKAAEPNTLVVCVPLAQRDEMIAADPDTYYLKPHYQDYPCVLVRLSRIHPDALRDLLRMGWEFTNARAAKKRARPAAKKTRRG